MIVEGMKNVAVLQTSHTRQGTREAHLPRSF